jgi:hypothetical protein
MEDGDRDFGREHDTKGVASGATLCNGERGFAAVPR